MVTFNVDSLDFEDDEEARFGSNTDYATRFDSANSRLELEDLTNATVGYVPQDVGTDLVGGKYAQTVAEGKALADDGNVYDSIQTAVNNASSYVKVGPGEFRESVTIDTAGLTLQGSGDRTVIMDTVTTSATNVSLSEFKIENASTYGIHAKAASINVYNVTIDGPDNNGINIYADNGVVYGCTITNVERIGVQIDGSNNIVSECVIEDCVNQGVWIDDPHTNNIIIGNIFINTGTRGIRLSGSDCVIGANFIKNTDADGIEIAFTASDNVFFNNRLSDAGGIEDTGTGTVLDGNLIT